MPCIAVSLDTNSSIAITWRRSKGGTLRGGSEPLTDDMERVSVFNSEEQRENGVIIVRSILQLGCLELEDAGIYSCQATNAAINKTADFLINVNGMNNYTDTKILCSL